MSYRDYQSMLSGKQPPELPPGWEARDFRFEGSDGDWYGTGYVNNGVPRFVQFYIWEATDPQLNAGIKKTFGKMVRWTGGNGHYNAELEIDND